MVALADALLDLVLIMGFCTELHKHICSAILNVIAPKLQNIMFKTVNTTEFPTTNQ